MFIIGKQFMATAVDNDEMRLMTWARGIGATQMR